VYFCFFHQITTVQQNVPFMHCIAHLYHKCLHIFLQIVSWTQTLNNGQLDTNTEKEMVQKKQSHHQWKTSNQLSTSLISLFFQASQIFQTISVFDNIEKQYVKLLT